MVNDLLNGWVDFAYSPFQTLLPGDAVNSGSSVIYHCNDNFMLIGRDTNFCENGVWDHDPPRCFSNCSLDVLDPLLILDYSCNQNGKDISCSNRLEIGSTLRINCPDTETTTSIAYFRDSTCEWDGKWSPKPTSCKSPCVENSIPWKVYIFDGQYTRRCLGTILKPNVILATVYCFWNETTYRQNDLTAYQIAIAAGNYTNWWEFTKFFEIESIIYDVNYKLTGRKQDTVNPAFAVLKHPLEYNGNIIPICIFPNNDYEKVLRYKKSGVIPELITRVSYGEPIGSLEVKILATVQRYFPWIPTIKSIT